MWGCTGRDRDAKYTLGLCMSQLALSSQSLDLISESCVTPLDPPKYILPRYVRPGGGFVPNFQLFEKGDVNGEKEQKVYTFLKVRVGSLEKPLPQLLGPQPMDLSARECPGIIQVVP